MYKRQNPDRVFTDLEEDGLYKVSDFDNLTIRPAYKDLKADKLEDGQKDSNGKYIFYLQKGGKISGSLLNDLIKKGINAEFIEYASEKDYDNENTCLLYTSRHRKNLLLRNLSSIRATKNTINRICHRQGNASIEEQTIGLPEGLTRRSPKKFIDFVPLC